jgi:glycosyltransferase involved in cell wall biosynthesis
MILSTNRAKPKGPPDGMWRPHAEKLAEQVVELESQVRSLHERPPPPPWPAKRSITVILTVHNRQALAQAAFQSILNAGFSRDQILLVESGSARLNEGVRYFTCEPGWTNNQCWLRALEQCSTSHAIFLHDDDLMAPGLADKLESRGDWEAACWDADFLSDGRISSCSSYFKCREGVYHGRLLSDISASLDLTISTIQGCFPVSYLIEVFREWEASFSGPQFHVSKTMVAGNDLLIWLNAWKLKSVWVLRDRYSVCRQHSESTTVQGILDGSLAGMYAEVRKLKSAKRARLLQICHLYGSTSHERFLSNLDQNRPVQPVEFMSHRSFNGKTVRTIPNYEKGSMSDPKTRYGAANCAFAEAAKMVEKEGFDGMLYLETDCRFKGDGWDDVLRQEYLGSSPVASCVGSPVCWGAFTSGHKQSMALIDYAYRYQQDTGRMMAFEGATDTGTFSLYPNGAIAYYTPSLLREAYLDGADKLGLEKHARSTEPYDLHIGRIIGSKGFEYAVESVGWLRSSYSGCLDHHYRLSDRISMLDRGEAVCIHQCK